MIYILLFILNVGTNFPSMTGSASGMTIRALVEIPITEAIKKQLINTKITVLNADAQKVKALLTETEIQKLKELGIEHHIILDDYRDRARKILANGFYHTYDQFVQELNNIATSFPEITFLDTLGYSVEGRPILGLKISDNPQVVEPEPGIRFTGCHHGDEYISAEIVLYLAHYLTDNYSLLTIKELVDTCQIWLIPMVNPDGMVAISRYNALDVDLNRNYGYMWWEGGEDVTAPFSQPETRAVRENALLNKFVLGFDYHSVDAKINCLWDYTDIRPKVDSAMLDIAKEYADFTGYEVIHGFDWYPIYGSCQDAMYGCEGFINYTIETPEPFDPAPVCEANLPAILAMLKRAGNQGIAGLVADSISGTPIDARVNIKEINWPIYTDTTTGYYHCVLLPGTYTLEVSANGYLTKTISGIIVENSITHLNASLTPCGGIYAHRVVWVSITDTYYVRINHTLTPSVLGAPDNIFLSLGTGGMLVVDMKNPVIDSFTIYEGQDGIVEGYEVLVSNDWTSAFQSVGTGLGTKTFAIAGNIRYIKIIDDGDDEPDYEYAGFDLDAVKGWATTGIEESSEFRVQSSELKIYPTIVRKNGVITIQGLAIDTKSKPELKIYDLSGRLVKSFLLTTNNQQLTTILPGIYFIKISRLSGTDITKKLIILD